MHPVKSIESGVKNDISLWEEGGGRDVTYNTSLQEGGEIDVIFDVKLLHQEAEIYVIYGNILGYIFLLPPISSHLLIYVSQRTPIIGIFRSYVSHVTSNSSP